MTKKHEMKQMLLSAPTRPRRKQIARLATAAACALVLSACDSRREIHGSVPDDYRKRHPISLEQGAKTIDIPVGSHSENMSPASASAVRAFARDFHLQRAAVIQIMMPSGSENESAAGYLGKKVRLELIRAGVRSTQIDMLPYTASQATDAPIRLAYPLVQAKSPKCGTWPADLGENHQNRAYFNFGCATQANLASAVANPQDLIQPRGWDQRDSTRRAKVNDQFRSGSPTWSEDLGSKVGTASEVGK